MKRPIIRAATIDDADALFPLVGDYAPSFVRERAAFDVALKQILEDANACLLVADTSVSLVGYVFGLRHPTVFSNGPVSSVEELAVVESYRRHGVGRDLMDAFELWAQSHGCRRVGVATRRAEGFYQRLGYEQSHSYFRKLL
jgi:GNAT superfamily N-acetyltransferase